MSDLISRQWLMECIDEGWIKFDTEKDANIYIHLIRDIAPSAQPEQAVKDCRNCKHGKYNDHLETHFCYNPNECTEWELWEPSAQPEEFEWCHDCKEYDQTEHCCHRWTKVIRQTVEEIKAEQPERKSGKWINEHWDGDSNFRIDGRGNCWLVRECSNCHEEIKGNPANYCPNCGCRMLKEGD